MNIEEVYKSADKIILKHLMLNDDAMKTLQSLGYNGFKRMHRVNTRCLLEKHIELENNMFDKYRKVLNVNVDFKSYKPINIKSHLESWMQTLDEDIKLIGNLNYMHMQLVGVSNSTIEDVLKQFLYDYEKVCRWYERFNETNWNPVEMHIVDDALHEKIKKYEE